MPTPGEHKAVQARILAYSEAIGWTFVSREQAEQRRAPSPEGYGGTGGNSSGAEQHKRLYLFFDDLLDAKVREFNPRYTEAEVALLGQFRHFW